MSRWILVLFATVALGIAVSLVVLWPQPTPTPTPAPPDTRTPAPSLTPAPDGPSTSPTPAPTPSPCPAPGQTVQFSVLTFNIHGGLGHDRLGLDAIAEAIRASGADVVLLQETDRFRRRSGIVNQAAWLGRRLDMEWAYGPNKLRQPARVGLPRAAIGNAILSRFPLSDVSQTHLPNRPGMELRGLLHAHLSVGGQLVSIYTTHLQHTSGSMRIEQAHAIRQLVDLDPLPKILGGDLNAEPDSVTLGVLRRADLADTWRQVGVGAGLTVPAFVPRRRIDYLLNGEGIRPLAAEVRWSGISDHRELLARFEVRPADSC